MKSNAKLIVVLNKDTSLEITLKSDFLKSRFAQDEKLLLELVIQDLLVRQIETQEMKNGNET